MSTPQRNEVSITVKVANNLASPRTLVIEPWLTEYALPQGKSLDVVPTGDPKCALEVNVDDERITVFCFDSAGATMSVRDQGVDARHLTWPR
jgi:hypothetical protein